MMLYRPGSPPIGGVSTRFSALGYIFMTCSAADGSRAERKSAAAGSVTGTVEAASNGDSSRFCLSKKVRVGFPRKVESTYTFQLAGTSLISRAAWLIGVEYSCQVRVSFSW